MKKTLIYFLSIIGTLAFTGMAQITTIYGVTEVRAMNDTVIRFKSSAGEMDVREVPGSKNHKYIGPDLMDKAFAVLLAGNTPSSNSFRIDYYKQSTLATYFKIYTRTIRNQLSDGADEASGYVIELYFGYQTTTPSAQSLKEYYFTTTTNGTDRIIYRVNRDIVGKVMFDRMFALHMAAICSEKIIWIGFGTPGAGYREVNGTSIYNSLNTSPSNYVHCLYLTQNTEFLVRQTQDIGTSNWNRIQEENALVKPLSANLMFTQLLFAARHNYKISFDLPNVTASSLLSPNE